MEEIIEMTRNIIGDILKTDGRDCYTYESIISSKIFTLTEANVSASSIVIYKNGVIFPAITTAIPPITNWTYSSITGKITIITALEVGDLLEINYSYFSKYSDNELSGHIRSALSHLVAGGYTLYAFKPPSIIFPTPDLKDSNLIAIVASLLINGNIKSYKTPEITIVFNENESVSTKIKKLIRVHKKTYGHLDFIDLNKTTITDEDC